MKKILYLFLLMGLLCTSNMHAQVHERDCHTMDNLDELERHNPGLKSKMQEIERHTNQQMLRLALRSEEKVITIPVVVHVLYNTKAENISDEVIQSQINVLNEDYRRLNPDQTEEWSQAADAKIEFQLAKFDPFGNSTNGINRVSTKQSFFHPNNSMKFNVYGGTDAWPADQYLNIWVCDLRGSKMGYAQFPGGPAKTDGVVIDYAFFGKTNYSRKYNLGRTCTHEVGHWLNLRHVWGDGDCNRDDHVNDTPASSYPSYGCQEGKVSCGSRDMVSNFMDYSYDKCMNLFTVGQKARMRALFEQGGARASLLESHALGGAQDQGPDGDVIADCTNCEEDEDTDEVEVGCLAPQNPVVGIDGRYLKASWQGDAPKYRFEIKLSASGRWFGFNLSRKEVSIAGIQAGWDYQVRIKSICDDGTESDLVEVSRVSDEAGRFGDPSGLVYNNPASQRLSLRYNPEGGNLPRLNPALHPPLQLVETGNVKTWHNSRVVANPSQRALKVGRIQLFNMNGQLVVDQRIDTNDTFEKDLYIKHLQSGMYTMALFNKRGRLMTSQKIAVTNIF